MREEGEGPGGEGRHGKYEGQGIGGRGRGQKIQKY